MLSRRRDPHLSLLELYQRRIDIRIDAVLHVEYVLKGAVLVVSPEVCTRDGIDNLCRKANATTRATDAAFNDIPDTQFSADLLNMDCSYSVGKCRISRDPE
jgi:hypothetical protein